MVADDVDQPGDSPGEAIDLGKRPVFEYGPGGTGNLEAMQDELFRLFRVEGVDDVVDTDALAEGAIGRFQDRVGKFRVADEKDIDQHLLGGVDAVEHADFVQELVGQALGLVDNEERPAPVLPGLMEE